MAIHHDLPPEHGLHHIRHRLQGRSDASGRRVFNRSRVAARAVLLAVAAALFERAYHLLERLDREPATALHDAEQHHPFGVVQGTGRKDRFDDLIERERIAWRQLLRVLLEVVIDGCRIANPPPRWAVFPCWSSSRALHALRRQGRAQLAKNLAAAAASMPMAMPTCSGRPGSVFLARHHLGRCLPHAVGIVGARLGDEGCEGLPRRRMTVERSAAS